MTFPVTEKKEKAGKKKKEEKRKRKKKGKKRMNEKRKILSDFLSVIKNTPHTDQQQKPKTNKNTTK